jgi:FtsZ-binding cell division protein ZapB
VFQGSSLNKKETIRDSIENIKKIQYSTINIKDKNDESEKLNNFLENERKTLEDAKMEMDKEKENWDRNLSKAGDVLKNCGVKREEVK